MDLSGLNAVMAVRSPKRMTDRGWTMALYLDDRAFAEQSKALGAVFSGGAGGYLAGLGPLIGEVAGGHPAAIMFEKSDGSLHAEVAGALRHLLPHLRRPEHPPVPLNFDTDNLGQWMTHCHNVYHEQSRMMGIVGYVT